MLAAHTNTHTHSHTPVFLASRFSTTRTSKEMEEKDLKVSPRTTRNENIHPNQMQHGPCKRQEYLAWSNTTALSVFNVPCFNYNIQYTGHWLEGGQTAPLFAMFTNYCGFLTSHKFSRVLCNAKFHYIVLNSHSPVSTLNQYTPTLFKTYFTISCNQWPGRQMGFFRLGYPTKTPRAVISYAFYTSCQSHPS